MNIHLVVLCCLLLASQANTPTQTTETHQVRVYVSDSQSWEMIGGWGMSGNRNADGSGSFGGGGYTAGGARPQTAEIIKTFNQRCPQVTITNSVQKANFAVILDHEGGKGLVRHRNKIAVFNRDGDVIFSDSTRELGNSVKDACQGIVSAPPTPLKSTTLLSQTQPAVPQSVVPANSASMSQTGSDASIEITSTPPGADIESDGNFVGNTPSTIGASPGEHTISIKRNGYKVWERKIKVSSGKVHISADLEAATETKVVAQPLEAVPAQGTVTAKVPDDVGSVSITSDPNGADIYVDDSLTGRTPATLKLKPGQHYVRLFMKGYTNWSQQVTVGTGSETQVTATLTKLD